MKAFTLALALLFATSSIAQDENTTTTATTAGAEEEATAADESIPANVIGIAPLTLLAGAAFGTLALAFEYEQATSNTFSWHIAPNIFYGRLGFGDTALSGYGVGAGVGVRFFLAGTAPEGLFVSPVINVGYANLTATSGGNTGSVGGISYGLSGMIGYTFMLGAQKNINLSIGAGAGIGSSTASAGGATANTGIGFSPALRFNVGYGF